MLRLDRLLLLFIWFSVVLLSVLRPPLTFKLLADLGALGNYPGSPFLPSDSDILLDSPEPDDIGNQNFISC